MPTIRHTQRNSERDRVSRTQSQNCKDSNCRDVRCIKADSQTGRQTDTGKETERRHRYAETVTDKQNGSLNIKAGG